MKLSGGALLVAITISFVLALICGSLLMLAYYAKLNTITQQHYQKAQRNLQSAMALAPMLATEEGAWKDLYGENTDSVWMQKKRWGVYEVLITKSRAGLRELSSIALCGQTPEFANVALLVPDQTADVRVTGNTRIHGICMIPRSNFDEVSINGQSFHGSLPSKENVRAPIAIEEPDEKVLAALHDPALNYSPHRILPSLQKDSLYTILYSDTLVMYKGGEVLNLDNVQIKGMMLLLADSLIVVSRNCDLQQVILKAPRIVFQSGFHGSVQAIASDSLVVREDCMLTFPSALVLLGSDAYKRSGVLRVKANATIYGSIVCLKNSGSTMPRVILVKKSKIHGEVISTGLTEPMGQIYGSLRTAKLICNRGVPQENLLADTEIDGTKRSEYFAGAVLAKKNKKAKTVSWMR